MKRVATAAELRREVAERRGQLGSRGFGTGESDIAFVPTMGALHDGHLSLIDRARELAEVTVVSIFVNPTQFGPGEDFERYPRDLDRDADLTERQGADILFTPTVEEMYGVGDPRVRVVPGPLAQRLCGLARPDHFTGVLTVVAKLFGMVLPDVAVFGRKDFQQAVLIRSMVEELALPVRVEVSPIVRESDGLAMSSRNAYLSERDRERALSLSRGLCAAVEVFAHGESDPDRLKSRVRGTIREAGVEPEYVELVDPQGLDPVDRGAEGSVMLVAARVGETRLIDNVVLERKH